MHINHFPIRLKPDDIWLLIIQAFSNHVNANSEELRHYFVNFEGKKTLNITYCKPFSSVDKETFEDFSKQMVQQMTQFLGKDIIENLTPDFTTTSYDSKVIGQISIMGSFKKYFNYCFGCITCGIPYIILEGTVEDYKKIKSKATALSKYKFEWYISRIIPIIDKMIQAKEGNIDVDFFKGIIQNKVYYIDKICATKEVKEIDGWILKFFGYYCGQPFKDDRIEFRELNNFASQMLIVPFIANDLDKGIEYKMKYKVGFIGCDQNEKQEVSPVQGWIVSPIKKEEEEEENKFKL